jgi:hypothetical protein
VIVGTHFLLFPGMAWRRTFGGWAYQVSISPRSDRLAHKIRKRCVG